MNKHTPGPWEIVGATKVWRTGPEGAAVAIIADPECETSSDFRPATYATKRLDEAAANARLIAAAPDMLDVLRAVAKHFQDTDAPLGSAARALIARVSETGKGATTR